jgi:integrase
VPIGDILSLYGQKVATTRKKNTLRSFREGEAILLREFGADFCVHDLTRANLNDLLNRRTARKLAPITANKPCKVLRAALRYAVVEKKLKEMPLVVPTLTETKRKPRILSQRGFRKVRDACAHEGARLAVILAYQCGLRHDEIVSGLRIRDIEFHPDGMFTVEVRAHDGWTPKAHAERGVVIPETAFDAIRTHLANHRFEHDRDAPLIYWGTTAPRRYRDLYVPVREAFKAAKIYNQQDKSGLHMCRRTFASHLLSGGTDLKTVMEMGGWSTIEAVQRYLASTTEIQRRAAALLEVD